MFFFFGASFLVEMVVLAAREALKLVLLDQISFASRSSSGGVETRQIPRKSPPVLEMEGYDCMIYRYL